MKKDLKFSDEVLLLLKESDHSKKWLASKLGIYQSALSRKFKTGTWTATEKIVTKQVLA